MFIGRNSDLKRDFSVARPSIDNWVRKNIVRIIENITENEQNVSCGHRFCFSMSQ